MINPRELFEALRENGVSFYCGVPDSLLKEWCAYLAAAGSNHVIAANEGNAVALAAGHYLASGAPACVYLQNSGLGNAVNPLVSLADSCVYKIPMLLLVGWRGESGAHDEPQHMRQGEITPGLLDLLGISHERLPKTEAEARICIVRACAEMKSREAPYALLVSKDTFHEFDGGEKEEKPDYPMTREEALRMIVAEAGSGDAIVTTTGKVSRELFEYREERGEGHARDFLTVGSMGHASSIAFGIALVKPERRVWCVDGDGALIMHMGALAVIGKAAPANFIHIVMNNGAHESVGGQPTAGFAADICAVARACGYGKVVRADTKGGLADALASFREAPGPAFVEVRIMQGSRGNLGRPTRTPLENKKDFMEFLAQ